MSIKLRIQAALNRASQLRAAHAACIKIHITGQYPPPPPELNISQPRWLAMLDTVKNNFSHFERETNAGSTAWTH